MFRIILAVMALFLPMAHAATLMAASAPVHETIIKRDEKTILRELEHKIKTHGAFLKAATSVVEETKNPAAISFIKMAEASAKEGMVHYKAGDYELALEDLSESTQRAIHAIILAKNPEDAAVREFVIQEELIQSEKRDIERKVEMIDKGMAEVEAFIKTAERLAADDGKAEARKIEDAKALYALSRKALDEERLDDSLEDVRKAYTLVTTAIMDIKRSKKDIITFPPPAGTDDRDILQYEIKRNDAYVYFASQVVKPADAQAAGLLKAGGEARNQAEEFVKDGDMKKAISRLKESTELFIKAVKKSAGE